MVATIFISPAFSESSMSADINGDGVVDVVDYVTLAIAYGSHSGKPKWNPSADLNQDFVVDIYDLVNFIIIADNHFYGKNIVETEQSQGTFGPEDIVFETGYESGIKPFGWDACVGMPRGETYSSITSSTTHVRGGTKSVRLYKAPPPNTDADRRLEMRWYDTPKDVYVSWWVYFDSRWKTQDPAGWGTNLGGVQAYWGVDGKFTYWTSLRFLIEPTDREIMVKYYFSDFGDGTPYGSTENKYYFFSPKKYITDYLNQWVHFQVHLKFSTTNKGEYQAWFNDELICEDYGLKTDPEGYAGWSNYEWSRGRYGGPWVVNELYSTKDSMETWFWVDDTVCATEKVPEYYSVE